MTESCLAPIQAIVENDLCIGCGACLPTCPKNVIAPNYSDVRGANEVMITDAAACVDCSKPCGDVCPSIRPFSCGEVEEGRLGRIENVYIGYSKTFQFNGVSSSGGVIREICSFFIQKGCRVICLTESESEGKSVYEAGILRQLSDLDEMPGSIYHSVSFVKALHLLREHQGPFLLVAIPCHLEGITNYIRIHAPELAKKIIFRLGIICGWMYSDHGIANFVDGHKILGPVLDIKYRGEDKVGRLKIRTSSGAYSFDRRKWDTANEMLIYKSSFSTDVNRLRCRLCQNHLNIQSDLSVGDAWLTRTGRQKLSVLATRNEKGETLIKELKKLKLIEIEIGGIADLEESQSKNLVYGITARKLTRLFEAASRPVVRYGFETDLEKVKIQDMIKWQLERLKRYLLRSGKYRLYRIIYLVISIRHLSSELIRMKARKKWIEKNR